MPKISVIVPNYNNAKFLSRCLTSLEKQTEQDIEFLLLDDASTDESMQIMETYPEKDSRFKLYSFPKNQGVSVVRNKGIELASGSYLGFVDSDDFVDENYFEVLKNALEDTHLPMVGTQFYNEGKLSGTGEGIINYLNPNTPLTKGGVSIWNHLFTRDLVGNMRFLNHCRFEDAPFTISMHALGEKMYVTNKTHYYYQSDNPMSFNNRRESYTKESILDRFQVADSLDVCLLKSKHPLYFEKRIQKLKLYYAVDCLEVVDSLPLITWGCWYDLCNHLDVLICKKYGNFRSVMANEEGYQEFIDYFNQVQDERLQQIYSKMDTKTCEEVFKKKVKNYRKRRM